MLPDCFTDSLIGHSIELMFVRWELFRNPSLFVARWFLRFRELLFLRFLALGFLFVGWLHLIKYEERIWLILISNNLSLWECLPLILGLMLPCHPFLINEGIWDLGMLTILGSIFGFFGLKQTTMVCCITCIRKWVSFWLEMIFKEAPYAAFSDLKICLLPMVDHNIMQPLLRCNKH